MDNSAIDKSIGRNGSEKSNPGHPADPGQFYIILFDFISCHKSNGKSFIYKTFPGYNLLYFELFRAQ